MNNLHHPDNHLMQVDSALSSLRSNIDELCELQKHVKTRLKCVTRVCETKPEILSDAPPTEYVPLAQIIREMDFTIKHLIGQTEEQLQLLEL